MATWAKLLAIYTGTQDVVFGVVLSGRSESDSRWDNVIGPCITTVPYRTAIGNNVTNEAFLGSVQKGYAAVLRYQHVPLRLIQKWGGVKLDGHPLFDTIFLYDKVTEEAVGLWETVEATGEVEVRFERHLCLLRSKAC